MRFVFEVQAVTISLATILYLVLLFTPEALLAYNIFPVPRQRNENYSSQILKARVMCAVPSAQALLYLCRL